MPMGSFHEISGTLAWLPTGFTLFLDEGGYWALELGWRDFRRARKWLGVRVEAEGVRIGFNVLQVRSMRRAKVPEFFADLEVDGRVTMREKKVDPGSSPG